MIQQAEICKARTLFISRGILNENVISKSIMHSWVRSKLHHISVEILNVNNQNKKVNLTKLSLNGKELIKSIRNITATHSSIYLLNDKGLVLHENKTLNLKTPKIGSFSEEIIGTSAGGISVHSLDDSKVSGCEHYNQELIHFITESLVISEPLSHRKYIILILTPLRYASDHNQLMANLKKHYIKKVEEVSEEKIIIESKVLDQKPLETVNMVNEAKVTKDEVLKETSDIKPCNVFTLSVVEKNTVCEALEYYEWNLKKTAEALGIGRSTLYRKLKEYKINRV